MISLFLIVTDNLSLCGTEHLSHPAETARLAIETASRGLRCVVCFKTYGKADFPGWLALARLKVNSHIPFSRV